MQKKDKIYYIINVVVLTVAVTMLAYYLSYGFKTNIDSKKIIIILLYLTINIFKYIRLYLIFLEEKVPFVEFLTLYLKTTFASIIIPFKLGDIFSIYCYGYKIKNYKKAVLGILTNRFIDTLILLLFMIPTEVINKKQITVTSMLLLLFVIVFFIFITIMPATYKYLNQYLITNKPSKLNIRKLYLLEEINKICTQCRELVKGRIYLILVLSTISWTLEYKLIKILAGNNFSYNTFSNYINAAFYTEVSPILMEYLLIASITIFTLTVITYTYKFTKRIEGNK